MIKERFKKPSLRGHKNNSYHVDIPDGLFEKCSQCGAIIYTQDLIENYHVCPNCSHPFRLSPRERLSMILDTGSFVEWDSVMETSDPLTFPGYTEKIAATKKATSLDEAVITGTGLINKIPVAIGVMGAKFMMGSMGYVVGEKITRLVEGATKEGLPLILFCCSGGARMQEGIVSLMQMAKTSQALKKHDEAGLLYISVLTDPTTGGVMASFAMLGDIILAEPGALIGFAGPRVIEQTIRQKLPDGFQRAEYLLEHGFIDRICKRNTMKQLLYALVRS